jgi:O-antigen/teichoic acid export membrane protein
LIRMEDKISLLKRTFRQCALVGAAGLVYAITVPLLAPFLFGTRYAASVLVGQLLCVRFVIAILICPVAVVCYTLGFVRIYWIVNLVQLVAVVAANVILLPRIGLLGSAIALIINDSVGFIVVGALIWSKFVGTSQP